jgi:NAD(P)-dependent dehydrogenase (short-subunit alcohol dehydrogenase family)
LDRQTSSALSFNAGVYPRVKLLEMRESDWDYVLDINLKAGCFATIAFVKALMAGDRAAGSSSKPAKYPTAASPRC